MLSLPGSASRSGNIHHETAAGTSVAEGGAWEVARITITSCASIAVRSVSRKNDSTHLTTRSHITFSEGGIVAGDNKLLTYSILSDFGIAVPKIHAICHSLRAYLSCPSLKTSAEVMAYLGASGPYPLIAKPVLGIYSKDVSLLQHNDASADSVVLAEDGRSAVEGGSPQVVVCPHFSKPGDRLLCSAMLGQFASL